jgi:hypothetical protein
MLYIFFQTKSITVRACKIKMNKLQRAGIANLRTGIAPLREGIAYC